MLLPETLSILSKNPIFIALCNVVTTYFTLAQSLDHFYLINIIICYVIFIVFNTNNFRHSTVNGAE